ncbi:UNVERIFIED_CONTAM: hypothetical protein GTU68_041178 [Idotea baltica]|nr:hypothetical protein [Idotea baltica]
MHELMHSTGFWHEHSRGDRDSFIEIIWKNIRPGMIVNFDKYDWNTIQSLGVEYDLGECFGMGEGCLGGFGVLFWNRMGYV